MNSAASIGADSGRNARPKTFTDSSLLDAIVIPASLKAGDEQRLSGYQEHENELGFRKKRKKSEVAESIPSSNGNSNSSSSKYEEAKPSHELFVRRPRHKTREDRYDVKKKKKSKSNQPVIGRKQEKKAKKNDRKKAASKANKDLIKNFTSESIDQERLSVSIKQSTHLSIY